MIVVTAKMNVKAGQRNGFISSCQDLINRSNKEEGCISYKLYSDTYNPDELVMLEFWKDIESLNIHMETEHFKKFGYILDEFLDSEIEIMKYSAVAI
jgi:quinol monooxygenase YgiN